MWKKLQNTVDKSNNGGILWKQQASVTQLVEYHVANVTVAGSNPVTRSIFFVFFALKCQSFRVIFFVRIWMHNHGIKIKHLSDNDIANIIYRSAKAARDQRRTASRDGDGVRFLAEPFTKAQKRELLSKAKASGLKSSPVLHKIIYGGNITRNGNTVNFNGKNSHQIKKHLVGEGLSPVEGFIGFDDIEFILPKALETQWEPDRKKNKKERKKQ